MAITNLGEHHFGGVEAVKPIIDFRWLILRNLIEDTDLSQYERKTGEIKIKVKKNTYGEIITKVPPEK